MIKRRFDGRCRISTVPQAPLFRAQGWLTHTNGRTVRKEPQRNERAVTLKKPPQAICGLLNRDPRESAPQLSWGKEEQGSIVKVSHPEGWET